MHFHESISLTNENLSFAGLVEDNFIISLFVIRYVYFIYSLKALSPFEYIWSIFQLSNMIDKSAGITFLLLLSLDPVISQLSITSQSAILLFKSRTLF